MALPVATTPVRKRITSKRRADGDSEVGASQTVDILAARTDPEAHGSHRQKGFWRDQFVAHVWNNIPRDLRGFVRYRSFRPRCRDAWMSIPDGLKQKWYNHCLYPLHCPISADLEVVVQSMIHEFTKVPGTAAFDFQKFRCRGPGTQETEEDPNNRVHGFILTWNGRWGSNDPGIQRLIALKLPWRAEVQAIRQHPFYQWLWKHFVAWANAMAELFEWPQRSYKMELTLNRAKLHNVVHFHLCLSDPSQRHRLAPLDPWRYAGVKPHVTACGAKGNKVWKSVNTVHYYCQAPKIGSVFVRTNYERFTRFPVEGGAIYALWRLYKMTDASAIREITLSRCRGAAGYIRDINANTNWRRNHQEKVEQAWLQMRVPLKASKMYPAIFAWMQLFNNDSLVRTRFPFLVLNGPSHMGKTRYASQLFGIAKTLVLSCQGVLAPNLKPFRRHEHSCIVFDEGSHDMVFRNKQVFQAGVDVVMLGQSNCNEHAYACWLYGIPLVVSTNDWLVGASVDQAAWLNANSVVIQVTEPMWLESAPIALTDGVATMEQEFDVGGHRAGGALLDP